MNKKVERMYLVCFLLFDICYKASFNNQNVLFRAWRFLVVYIRNVKCLSMLSRFNFFPRLLRLCYGSLSLHVCFWQRKKVDCHWNIWLYLRMDFCTICSWIELFLLDARWLSPYASFTILKTRIRIICEFKPKIFKSTIISNFWMNNHLDAANQLCVSTN